MCLICSYKSSVNVGVGEVTSDTQNTHTNTHVCIYCRLTLTLGFMLLLYTYGVYNLVSGPLWPTLPVIDPNCVSNSTTSITPRVR